MATIGDTNNPSTNTVYYDSLISTSLAAYRDTLVDNIFKDSAFLAALREYGGVQKQDGGERIAQPIMYSTSSNSGSYSNYDTLD